MAQPEAFVAEDLREGWRIYSEGSYRPYQEGSDASAIYFTIDPGRYRPASILKITSAKPFSLYLNRQLIALKHKAVHIDLDSMQSKLRPPWYFAVHQPAPFSWLSTSVASARNDQTFKSVSLRPPYYFLDFSILAVLVLLLIFVLLFRNNPKLTLDYFSVVRLFSIQEREEVLLSSRVLSSVNMLYYGLVSLLTGFTLLVLFRYGGAAIPAGEYFTVSTLAEGFIQWFRLAVLVFFILMLKLLILTLLGTLFQIPDKTAAQFYNYIRLIFFVFGLTAMGCLVFFMSDVQAQGGYIFLLKGIMALLFFWVFMASLKLMGKIPLRFFQLFSYLCLSELIPMVFIIKVLIS